MATAKRIVVADDDRLILATLGAGLREAGYEVFEATDGEAALTLCRLERPDLALLDVRMPGLSGAAVAERLAEEGGTPVVFLSAYSDMKTVEAALDKGGMGYLVKPLDVPQIIPTIEAALARAGEMHVLRKAERNLTTALESSREISVAVGLLMERHRLASDEAFERLRRTARSQRRRVQDVAVEIVRACEAINLCKT